MKFATMRIGLAAAALGLVLGSVEQAKAGLTLTTFDSASDVQTTNPAAPNYWGVDRYAPNAFSSGEAGGGRTGVLKESISSADSMANRPSGYNSAFYNTQGRSTALDAGTQSISIELFVDSAWDALSQLVGTSSDGRLAGLWGITNNASDQVTQFYPILEFNNNRDGQSDNGFRIFNGTDGTWTNVGGFTGYDQWYTLGIELAGANTIYKVNGVQVATSATLDSATSLSRVILQGYNTGNSYDIYWDNGQSSDGPIPTPEPATLVSAGMAVLLSLGYGWRKRRAKVAA